TSRARSRTCAHWPSSSPCSSASSTRSGCSSMMWSPFLRLCPNGRGGTGGTSDRHLPALVGCGGTRALGPLVQGHPEGVGDRRDREETGAGGVSALDLAESLDR